MTIKTQFNVNNTVWVMENNVPIQKKIGKFIVTVTDGEESCVLIEYGIYEKINVVDFGWRYFEESKCFKSKKDLLDSFL